MKVEVQDVGVVEFPDDASPDEISKALNERYPSPARFGAEVAEALKKPSGDYVEPDTAGLIRQSVGAVTGWAGKRVLDVANLPTTIANKVRGAVPGMPNYVEPLTENTLTPQIPRSKGTGAVAGAYNLAASTAQGMVPPFAPPQVGLSLPALAVGGAPARVAGAAFGTEALSAIPEQYRAAKELPPTATTAEKVEAYGTPIVGGALGALMLKGAVGKGATADEKIPVTYRELKQGEPNAIQRETETPVQLMRQQPVEGAGEVPTKVSGEETGARGEPVAQTKKGEVLLTKPDLSADELINMRPDELVTWKKNVSLGAEVEKTIAQKLTDEDIPKLELERDNLRAKAAALNSMMEKRGKVDDRTMKVAGEESVKAQTINEILQEREALKQKPAVTPEGVPTKQLGTTETPPVSEPELVGLGGAVSSEFGKGGQTPTSIKNAQVDIERQQRGLPPVVQPAKKAFGTVWDQAMAKIDKDPGYTDRLIDELREKPRALTDAEDATLLHRQIELQNEYGNATRDLAQAFDDGRMDAVGEQQARVAAVSDQLLDLYNIGKKVGTETGRGLNARKMMAYEDSSLAKMELEKRAANGGRPLTDVERSQVTELQKRIETTQKAYDDYVSKTDQRIAELEVKRALDEVERQSKKEPSIHPRILNEAERVVKLMEKSADAARARLREKFARTSAGVDPTILADLSIIGAAKIARGVVEFGKWSDAMVKDIGEGIQPFLKEAWDAANKRFDESVDKYAKAGTASQVKRAVKRQDAKEQGDAIGVAIKRKVDAGNKNDISPQAQKLARLFVELGVKDRNELIDSVHAELKKYLPEITRRETMDAISGYGDFKQLTKDEISVQLRDLKGQMQQVGKLEDMQRGQAPAKTGVERRTPSDEERRLIKQVEEAKKRGGYVVTNPATQLRSALQSIKTRLENQIADLEHEISTKTKIVREKNAPPTSPEVEALKARRDELKTQRDELFGNRELTDEQRVKMAMRAVEKSIAEYDRRIRAKELVTPKKPSLTPETPELKAARAKRDALKEQLQELRDLDPALQAERRANALESEKKALEKTIAEQERRLREGDLSAKSAPMNRPADPALESLKQRRDSLTKQLSDARKKPEAQKHAEAIQRRLENMNKAIASKEAKLASGDIAPSAVKKQNRPLIPELEQAKQRLELLNKQIEEMRKGPTKTPEERALQALKTRLANQIEQYQDKLAKGDFTKKPKRIVQMDAEANRLHFENAKAKLAWHEALMKDRLANRSIPAKILGAGAEVLNTSRAIMTSLDLSAVLRQGGFIALAHPVRALKSFPAMFRAFRSEAGQHAVNQEIMARKNYPLYNQSKLYLSEHGHKLSQMEEAYMSRWADKIPLVAGSQRAYVTFLNKLRADSFDAMANSLSRSGELTPTEANAISNFINVSTGRGNLGMKENALVGLNTIFFAPRYVASRFQLIAGQPLYRGTARTRALVAKEYARFLIGVGTIYALAKMGGADVETDSRSSDFGKIRIGNTRVDPLAGLAQATVLTSRLATGETKTLGGKVVPIRGSKVPYGSPNSADVLARFLRTKLSPAIGTGADIATGTDVTGRPVTPASVASGLLVPLSMRDIYQVMREQGVPAGTALAILSMFGMGVQTYDEKKKAATN